MKWNDRKLKQYSVHIIHHIFHKNGLQPTAIIVTQHTIAHNLLQTSYFLSNSHLIYITDCHMKETTLEATLE